MNIKLQVAGLSLDPLTKSPVLVLSTQDNAYLLPVWIGSSEAISISLILQGTEVPRPMTHDLLLSAVEAFGFVVKSVQIPRVEDGVFYAAVELTNGKDVHLLDSRPSDAVALALRVGAPIFTSQQVIDDAGFEFPDDDDNPSVPVTAGDGGIAMLDEEHDLGPNVASHATFDAAPGVQGTAKGAGDEDGQEMEELQALLKGNKSIEKEVADLLEKMDPESKYKM